MHSFTQSLYRDPISLSVSAYLFQLSYNGLAEMTHY